MIRITTSYSLGHHVFWPLIPTALNFFLVLLKSLFTIPFSLRNYTSPYLYILSYYLLLSLSFFLNLESSLIYDILPSEPYLLVASYLQGRDIFYVVVALLALVVIFPA
jgi:hypothetical protein